MAKTKKRASKKKANTDVIKEGGKTFKKTSCHDTVKLAKEKAKRLKAQGYTFRRKGKCVFKGAKRKK